MRVLRQVNVCWLAAALWVASPLLALTPDKPLDQLRQDVWSTSDGLPQSSVHAILQTRRGFLWLATQEGLARFDGLDFEVFDRVTHPELASNIFSSLAEGADGSVWAGSEAGLVRFDGAQASVYDEDEGLASPRVRALLTDHRGTLWVGSTGGLDRWVDGRLEPVTLPEPLGERLAAGVIALELDPAGWLWAGTNGRGLLGIPIPPSPGSLPLDAEHHVHTPVDGPRQPILVSPAEGLASGAVHDLDLGIGRLWIANGAAVQWRDTRGQMGTVPLPEGVEGPVYAVREDLQGSLWIGTNGNGVVRSFRGVTERWMAEEAPKLVRAIFEDREGDVWIGSAGGDGLWRLADGALSTLDTRRGLSHERVYAVFEDSRGNAWFGSFGGGLDRQGIDGTWQHFGPEEGLASDLVWSLAEDRHGALWVGTYGAGLHRLVDDRLEPALTTADGLSNDFVRTLLEDHRGHLWIGTRHGLNRLADGSLEIYSMDSGLPSRSILSLLETRDQTLWVGTTRGIGRFDSEGFTQVVSQGVDLTQAMAYALYEDDNGSLWIGTQDRGLIRYRDGRAVAITTDDGLYDNLVFSILEDAQKHLWLSCNKGLQRLPRSELDAFAAGQTARVTPQVFGARDGMKNAEANGGSQPVAWRRHDGTLMFATVSGATIVDPRLLQRSVLPAPALESLWLDHRRHLLGDRLEGPWQVSPEVRRLTFDFTAPSFSQPAGLHFRHRLVGFDPDWSPSSPQRSVSYTDLPPGRYRFEVLVGNRGGPWSAAAASLDLTLLPPWWRTPWALALYAACFLGAATLLARWQQRRVENERLINAELRAVGRVKSALLANTSHELRTPLYGMIGIAEAQLADAAGLRASTREGLRQIVASGHRLGELVDNLLAVGGLAKEPSPHAAEPVQVHTLVQAVLVRFRAHTDPAKTDLVNTVPHDLVVTTDRGALTQILLQLIDNAIKFTPEGAVRVEARRHAAHLELQVDDEGIGMEPEDLQRILEPFEQADSSIERRFGGAGLGLAVTRRHIEQLGGQIDITSRPGQGTQVVVRLPERRSIPEASPDRRPETSSASLQRRTASHDPPRLLIVDDEVVNRVLLRSQLENAGFEVDEVDSGPAALDRLTAGRSREVDLVILDIMMPEMSGYEVCRTLRRHPTARDLPVLFLSARDQVADIVTGFESGGDDYLLKPARREELVRRVRTLLGDRPVVEG